MSCSDDEDENYVDFTDMPVDEFLEMVVSKQSQVASSGK